MFVVIGILILVAYFTGQFPIANSKLWIFILFEFFALVIGGVIVISQIINFVSPFVMLKTDDQGIYFGTGWRYQPYFIAWENVKSAAVVKSTGFPIFTLFKNCDNLSIKFQNTAQLPAFLATSAGIIYIGYTLTLDGNYIDTPAQAIVDAINKQLK